jgi:hypothetical protein
MKKQRIYVPFIAALTATFLMLGTALAFASVSTDQYLYNYGDTVQITGDGMDAWEGVSVDVNFPDGSLAQYHQVAADELGDFSDSFYLADGMPGGVYTVVATGLSSGNVYTTEFDPPIGTTLTTPTLSSASITYGSSVTISGSLTVGTGGTLSGHTIRLQAGFDGGGLVTTAYTTTTDGSGNYSFTYTPAAAGSYVFRTQLNPSDSGNGGYSQASSGNSATLTVAKAGTTTIAANNADSPHIAGNTFSVDWIVSSTWGVTGNTATGSVAPVDVSGPASLPCNNSDTTVSGDQTTGSGFEDHSTGGFQCTPTVAGTYVFKVVFTDTDGNYDGSESAEMTVTVVSSNSAPTDPGNPTTSSALNKTGVFTLSWTASTDPDAGDTITYTLEHKDADDAGYSTVASGLTTNSYAFVSGSEEGEGTWDYRVQAVDDHGATSTGYGESLDLVKVDKTKPNAPTASATTSAAYTDGSGHNWWADTVTIHFADNGDPVLQDTSAGSGVNSVSADQTKTTAGLNTASGSATDNATNVSDPGTLDVYVDTQAPTASFTNCPGSVYLNASTSASWTASDPGAPTTGSGLATAASGSVALVTNTVGSHTVYSPVPSDNVGHTGTAASCTYNVAYKFVGFSAPVDNPGVLNTVKAGQAIPLKWRLLDANDQPVTDLAIVSVKAVDNACSLGSSTDLIEEVASGSSGLQNLGDGYYQFNWKSPTSYAKSCKTTTVNLGDGTSSHYALFQFTK